MTSLTEITIEPSALRKARENAGLKQAEAARRLGISRQLLNDYESETKRAVPSGNVLTRILILYRTNAAALTNADENFLAEQYDAA